MKTIENFATQVTFKKTPLDVQSFKYFNFHFQKLFSQSVVHFLYPRNGQRSTHTHTKIAQKHPQLHSTMFKMWKKRNFGGCRNLTENNSFPFTFSHNLIVCVVNIFSLLINCAKRCLNESFFLIKFYFQTKCVSRFKSNVINFTMD